MLNSAFSRTCSFVVQHRTAALDDQNIYNDGADSTISSTIASAITPAIASMITASAITSTHCVDH